MCKHLDDKTLMDNNNNVNNNNNRSFVNIQSMFMQCCFNPLCIADNCYLNTSNLFLLFGLQPKLQQSRGLVLQSRKTQRYLFFACLLACRFDSKERFIRVCFIYHTAVPRSCIATIDTTMPLLAVTGPAQFSRSSRVIGRSGLGSVRSELTTRSAVFSPI